MPTKRLFVVCLILMSGCTSARFIGHSGEVGEADTPKGFAISPTDAVSIVHEHRGAYIMVDDVYHDDRFYYVTQRGLGGSKASIAKRHGYIVDGMTGKLYDREADKWLEPASEVVRAAHTVNRDRNSRPTGRQR